MWIVDWSEVYYVGVVYVGFVVVVDFVGYLSGFGFVGYVVVGDLDLIGVVVLYCDVFEYVCEFGCGLFFDDLFVFWGG